MMMTSTPKSAVLNLQWSRPLYMENNGLSSKDFDEQIKQLEIEGSRLLSSAHNLSDTLGGSSATKSTSVKNSKSLSKDGASFSAAFFDISAEQRTIDEIRLQLEAQTREADSLTQHLLQNHTVPHPGLDNPLSQSSADVPTRIHSTPYNPSYALSALRPFHSTSSVPLSSDYRFFEMSGSDTIIDLRTKLSDALAIAGKQKLHFQRAIEDLQLQLKSCQDAKDSLLSTREREVIGEDSALMRMKKNCEHLEQSNRAQEKLLLEMNERLESQQRERHLIESYLDQVRGQVLDQERKKGRSFSDDGVSVLHQDTGKLVRCIDRCIQELDLDVEMKTDIIKELTAKAAEESAKFADIENCIHLDFKNRLSEISRQHKLVLSRTDEQLRSSTNQISHLEDEISRLKEQMSHQLQLKSSSITDLDSRLHVLHEEHAIERNKWNQQKSDLETSLSQARKNHNETLSDRNRFKQTLTDTESQLAELQKVITALRNDNETLACEMERLRSDAEVFIRRENELNDLIKERDVIIDDLKSQVLIAHQETDQQLKEMAAEKDGEQTLTRRVQALTFQLSAVTEKSHKLNLDLELSRTHHEHLTREHAKLERDYETTRRQLELTTASKDQLNNLLTDRLNASSQLARERDDAVKSCASTLAELAAAQFASDKLKIQLEERERNFMSLKEQLERVMEKLKRYEKTNSDSKRDKEEAQQTLVEKESRAKMAESERDKLAKKAKGLEKKIAKCEQTNEESSRKMQECMVELEELKREREYGEREELENKRTIEVLKDMVDELRLALTEKEGHLGKELNHISEKLKSTSRDLRLSKKALQAQDHVDLKAVEVASQMQKEVTQQRNETDTLMSKMRQLEDSLDTCRKEKRMLADECKGSVDQLKDVLDQKKRLAQECRSYITKNSQLQTKLKQLEEAVEKATAKEVSAQSQVEQYAQDIARLKLKHQLELKELERTGYILRSQHIIQQDQPTVPMVAVTDSEVNGISPKAATLHNIPMRESLRDGRVDYPMSIKPVHIPTTRPQVPETHLSSGLTAGGQSLTGEYRCCLEESSSLAQTTSVSHNCTSAFASVDEEPSVPVERRLSKYLCDSNAADIKRVKDACRYERPVHDTSVYELIAGNNGTDSDSGSVINAVVPIQHQPSTSVRKGKSLNSDTVALCQRLERKCETLSKLGGGLHRDNQDIALGMREHQKKLKNMKNRLRK